ncbi:MAG: hypothetical protein FJ115_07080 [Deltaproteobacteria bacterium]|nr:hypothetical protein [Deltaproteobacteria bacterium]
MKHLYMDNFRGFSDTIIPIRQVTFLVGENSTGKTSLLGLLELLSNPRFWFTQDFNSQTYEFGGFSDIVSATTTDKREFRIGTCEDGVGKNPKVKPFCYLMHFRERDGIPIISRFAQATEDWVGTIVVDKGLFYNIEKLQNICSKTDDPYCLLRAVQTHTQQLTSGLSKVPKSFKFHEQEMMAYPYLLKILSKSELTKNGMRLSRRGIHFEFELPLILDLAVLAPIRTKPRRTYDAYAKPFSPDGEHTPYLLRKQLASKMRAKAFTSVLEKFGIESGLFKKVGIKEFGKEPSAPFEVTVTLEEQPLTVNTVGYGVSQALPVVVELISRSRGTSFSIQQPEVHLHPKAQAALGDLLFELASQENKNLFIETHSDYLVDRYRLNYRQQKGPDSQVLFFERTEGRNKVHILPIAQNGEYPEIQPSSFRTFFLSEQRRILGI